MIPFGLSVVPEVYMIDCVSLIFTELIFLSTLNVIDWSPISRNCSQSKLSFILILASIAMVLISDLSMISLQISFPFFPPKKRWVISLCSRIKDTCSLVALRGMGTTLNPNARQAKSTRVQFN